VSHRSHPLAFRSLLGAVALVAATACTAASSTAGVTSGTSVASGSGSASTSAAAALPTPAHVVIVMEENHAYSQIIGSSSAPYINSLANSGALMTQSYAITHPSEPNYLALFAGSTFGLSSDACPVSEGSTANLGSELLAAGHTFVGYSESLPSAGYTGCTSGEYARKHAPWVNFSNIPSADNQPFSAFPSNYANLPTVSIIDPNLLDDMHDGSVAQGDTWLKSNLSAYATWAKANNSLLIVTWDEDNDLSGNHIATIVYGAHVATGQYSETINHYNVLRTVEALYGLPYAGSSASATTISDIWN
jgi:acid phosphatase